jgi:hypothetical protein
MASNGTDDRAEWLLFAAVTCHYAPLALSQAVDATHLEVCRQAQNERHYRSPHAVHESGISRVNRRLNITWNSTNCIGLEEK